MPPTTRLAAIDIGTNSVLLTVAEESAGRLHPLEERATITRLGRGVDRTRRLAGPSRDATIECLREYAAIARRHDVDRVAAVATSAVRDATDGDRFLDAAERVLGVRPHTITGREEAELTFEGAVVGLDLSGHALVCDIGGGSTEIIHGRIEGEEARIIQATSLDIGSVRLTERHVSSDPPAAAELERARGAIRKAFAPLGPPAAGAGLVGVAGTVTTLAAIALALEPYSAERVHGARLPAGTVKDVLARLVSLPLPARRSIRGLEPGRADIIVCGALIADELLSWAKSPELRVSDRGVRWGLLRRLARPARPAGA